MTSSMKVCELINFLCLQMHSIEQTENPLGDATATVGEDKKDANKEEPTKSTDQDKDKNKTEEDIVENKKSDDAEKPTETKEESRDSIQDTPTSNQEKVETPPIDPEIAELMKKNPSELTFKERIKLLQNKPNMYF